jgi:L-alanine-DL-glutamate epimerase-like enolase superfamily enzyme
LKVHFKEIELPFRHPFTISKGTKVTQPDLVVALEWKGILGYGEAPAITYYDTTTSGMAASLSARKDEIERFAMTSPDRFWHFLHHLLPQDPFLVCALDIAGWDLHGRLLNKPLWRLWDLDPGKVPVTDYTIGIDTPERMVEKMLEKPWPVYKIKVGIPGDMERLEALRRHTDASIRVDANGGWSLAEALDKIPRMRDLGVELVEQPLARNDWEGMRTLFDRSPLPLFADEACVGESDVDRCAGHFHGINIKLTKCSGITPARRMIRRARELGMQVMLGCMNESSIGSAAMVHLSPLVDHLDADGPLLLSRDIATGLAYANGRITMPSGPGLGVVVDNSLFERSL